jgi:hypothetical protein
MGEKAGGGLDKRLANLWSRKQITKRPALFVGKKAYGKSRLTLQRMMIELG